jgi:hypothetical protein
MRAKLQGNEAEWPAELEPRAVYCVGPVYGGPARMSRAEEYRKLARECLKLANMVPANQRHALQDMAYEWERLADQAQAATDLRQKE